MAVDVGFICFLTALITAHFLKVEMNTNSTTELPVNLNYKIVVQLRSGFVVYRTTVPNLEREFLILKMEQEDDWTFPEVPLEMGESELDAAERCLSEKIGLDMNDILYADEYQKTITHGYIPVNTTTFRVGELAYNKKIVPMGNCEQFKWLPKPQAYNLLNNVSREALTAIDDFLTDMNC